MTAIILRRRKLGRGSSSGIVAASTTGIKAVRNWKPRDWPTSALTYVFRWGCTSSMAGPHNLPSIVTVNTASSIHWCADKKKGRLDMQAAGVPVPETFATASDVSHLPGKYVLRPRQHAQGKHVYVYNVAEDDNVEGDQLYDMVAKASELGEHYVSRLIDKVAEYRVFVCQGRAVWVANKTPGNPDDVAWNVAQGGRFDNVRWGDWPMAVINAAIAAANVSGTDFCGVDVMVDAAGSPYVLEVNSAPSQTSPYRQGCVAKAFDYIVVNGKEHFPTVVATSWREAIHPALLTGDEDASTE